MNEFISKFSYKNSSSQSRRLILEPWGEQYQIAVGQIVEVIGSGGLEGMSFEIDHLDECIIVYGWQGSIVKVLSAGVELDQDSQI
jgi:hypothetical protein